MTFIGIVSTKNNFARIRKYIESNLDIKYNLIYINSENIENIKNVVFETVVILNVEEIYTKVEELKTVLNKTKYIIINSDLKENLQVLQDLDLNVITFGFNNKATITASSIQEENALICVQRSILAKNKVEIEPQEIKININNENKMYELMGTIAVLLIYNEKNMEKIYKI